VLLIERRDEGLVKEVWKKDSLRRGPGRPRKRRTMSAEARRRISDAQKARWARQKANNAEVHTTRRKNRKP
jgi:hypothetical protein